MITSSNTLAALAINQLAGPGGPCNRSLEPRVLWLAAQGPAPMADIDLLTCCTALRDVAPAGKMAEQAAALDKRMRELLAGRAKLTCDAVKFARGLVKSRLVAISPEGLGSMLAQVRNVAAGLGRNLPASYCTDRVAQVDGLVRKHGHNPMRIDPEKLDDAQRYELFAALVKLQAEMIDEGVAND